MYRYSQGKIPHAGVEKFNTEALKLIILYGTTEYLAKPENGAIPPPTWTIPHVRESKEFVNSILQLREQEPNHETGSFPVYYVIAGLWYNAGQMLGMTGGKLLYWVRFLNIPLFVLLILVSYVVSQNLYAQQDSRQG